jgi:hypothetical protein
MRIHLQNLHNKPFIYVIQIFVTYTLYVTLKYFINVSLLSYCLVVSVSVAYATHNTLKPVPSLPRWQQTTVRRNGYQML